jgi:hypothetical protein
MDNLIYQPALSDDQVEYLRREQAHRFTLVGWLQEQRDLMAAQHAAQLERQQRELYEDWLQHERDKKRDRAGYIIFRTKAAAATILVVGLLLASLHWLLAGWSGA